ncbi:MAG: septal ring lytic transglycosylase RlpA family protein [Ignavibacterium sp.]|jgi:rare lipoprotein A|nr:septal ring lytic transglycosylase RlpA family protein [Ignavibacterium sp.]MDX9712087.1 septal ring lytic transglycosylase RlpA family protein [Ignavibacteriaceae bacterium]MEB2354193.1 septal ring lytic transglycosylase RlpA family protein [Ignavibacteriales bacterium]
MNLKIKLIISLNLLLILAACSSTSRYTKSSEENNRTNVSGYLEIQTGIASFYADEFNGKKTASGEIYNMNELTAAHPSYPFNTIVVVTNQKNNKSVRVRINDRMPGFKNRIIDLSLKAAEKIDMIRDGIQEVKVEVLKWGN